MNGDRGESGRRTAVGVAAWIVGLVFGRGRWKTALVAISVLFNVVVVVAVASARAEDARRMDHIWYGPDRTPRMALKLALNLVNFPPLSLLQPEPSVGATQPQPDVVYVASNSDGEILMDFVLAGDGCDEVRRSRIYDQHGRCWVSADPDTGHVTYRQYAAESVGDSARACLTDTDGDGVPDLMVEMATQAKYRRANELIWREVGRQE
ncbi:MAG TPA: hypothetical protein VMZ31_13950 [Phycisphaerae bacterium]|nr:hypothetical protein [Phycisphaerae bacterium]